MNILSFGKYKGQTFDYVKNNDENYCMWIISQKESNHSNFLEFKNYLLMGKTQKVEEEQDNVIINFGKNKGKTYLEVLKNDIDYCSWIISNPTSSPMMIKLKNYLISNHHMIIEKLKSLSSINCSQLTDFMKCDPIILNLIKEYEILSSSCEYSSDKNILDMKEIPKNLLGTFLDYLIRYEISKVKQVEFKDNRTEALVKYPSFYICNNITFTNPDGSTFEFKFSEEERTKIINSINLSYQKMKEFNATLTDVLNVSISHSLWFSEFDSIKYIDYEIPTNNFFLRLNQYIHDKFIAKIKQNLFLLNPILDIQDLGIKADADIIFGQEIIDIKSSFTDNKGKNKNDFIQLLVYSALCYKKNNITANKLTIFNPLFFKEYSILIDDKTIELILNRLIEYQIGKKFFSKDKKAGL